MLLYVQHAIREKQNSVKLEPFHLASGYPIAANISSLSCPFELKEKFLNNGTEIVGSTPEEFTAKIKSEVVKLGKVVKDANIKIE